MFLGIFWSNSCCQGEIWPWAVGLIPLVPCITLQHLILWYSCLSISVAMFFYISLFLFMWVCSGSGTELDVYFLSSAQSSEKWGAIHLNVDRGDCAGEAHCCWWEAIVEGNFSAQNSTFHPVLELTLFPYLHCPLFGCHFLGAVFPFIFFFTATRLPELGAGTAGLKRPVALAIIRIRVMYSSLPRCT